MDFDIRDVEPDDMSAVLALNNAAAPHVNVLPLAEMRRFGHAATYFRVAVQDGNILGFLVGFRPGAQYESENYLWFQARHDDFIYIDRIVVAPRAAGRGVAEALYADLGATMAGLVSAMTCEVNIRPENPVSKRMHRRLGFREVGQQETGGGEKRVSLLRKEL
jgi:predicted GNAT superfamily acetyltransferase